MRRVGLSVVALAALGWLLLGSLAPPRAHQPAGTVMTPVSTVDVDGATLPDDQPVRTSRLLIPSSWPIFTTHFTVATVNGPNRYAHAATPWYRADARPIHVVYGGSLVGPTVHVTLDVIDRVGVHESRPVRTPAQSSNQQVLALHVPDGDRFRVRLKVVRPEANWLLISAPYHPKAATGARLGDVGRTLLTALAVMSLLLVPGFAVSALRRRRVTLLTVALPGLAALCFVGALTWLVGGLSGSPRHTAGDPRVLAPILLAALMTAALVILLVAPIPRPTRVVWAVLAIYAGLVLTAAGRGLWSGAPPGETLGGTAIRTLEIGSRGDSRLPYSGALTALDGVSPTDQKRTANFGFGNWTLGDRGPVAPILTAPIVAGSGGRHIDRVPILPWQPIDPIGFFAFRIGMAAANLLAVPVLAGLAGALRGRRAALLAAALAATTPFLVHEGFFTWPKLLAAAFVLLAGHAALRGRAFAVGGFLLAGYLTHPLALLWAPSAALLWLLAVYRREGGSIEWSARGLGRLGLRGVAVVTVLACGVGVWAVTTAVRGHKSYFLTYLTQVNLQPVHSFGDWLGGRGESLANTMIPAWLPTQHGADPELNARGGSHQSVHSPYALHWLLQYWTTLPFGFGLAAMPLLLWAVWYSWRRFRPELVMAVFLPLLLFTAYWGGALTGMLREGLHPWILTLVVLCATCACGRDRPKLARWLALFATLRVIDVGAVLLGPVLFTDQPLVNPGFAVTDTAALITMLVPTLLLFGVAVWAALRSRRPAVQLVRMRRRLPGVVEAPARLPAGAQPASGH